jgi:putative phosphoribosyl transferase
MRVRSRRERPPRQRSRGASPAVGAPRPHLSRGVLIEAAGTRLQGSLEVPAAARGVVLFASSRDLGRIDSRQRDLAVALNRHGLGTLLFDLVDSADGSGAAGNVELLTERLIGATEWIGQQWGMDGLPIGYVSSGVGSAAALSAAAALGERIGAVASHAGRPDLAIADLGDVRAPTLLVVDPEDPYGVAANARVAAQLRCAHQLREVRAKGGLAEAEAVAPAIWRWLEWHLGSPDVPYEPRLALG